MSSVFPARMGQSTQLDEGLLSTCKDLSSWTALTFQRRAGISEHVVSLLHAAPSPRPEGEKNDRSRTESAGRQWMRAGFLLNTGSAEHPVAGPTPQAHLPPFLPHHPDSSLPPSSCRPTQPSPHQLGEGTEGQASLGVVPAVLTGAGAWVPLALTRVPSSS